MADPDRDNLQEILQNQYFGPDAHEAAELERLPELLTGANAFVDVGAGLGQYTFFANQIMRFGTIYSIEADPERFETMAKSCEEWAASSNGNQIVPVNAAAATRPGEASFFVTGANKSGGLFPYDDPAERAPSYEWRQIRVSTVAIDDVVGAATPELVKIDVEGAEHRVLLGCETLLRRGLTAFLVEVHPWGDPATKKRASDVFDLFATFGYDFTRFERHWLFQKASNQVKARIKNRLIHVVLDHPAIKSTVLKIYWWR